MSKRILSVILLICMLVNNLPVAAFAEGTDSGCSHVCDSSCGYVAAVACDKGCVPAEEGAELVHMEGCAFNAGSPCNHQHNGECGVACTHAYVEGVCAICGDNEPQPQSCAHTGGTATCKALAVCTTCDKGYGELADHTYSQGTCSVCGAVCEHSYNTEGICSVCGMAEPQPVCDCEVKCAETGNAACDFCGIDGADLTQCIGKEPKVECDCESKCTAENRNSDCLVCKAEDADLINCIGAEPENEAPVIAVSQWEWVENEDGVSIDREEDGTYVTDLPRVGSLEMVKSVLPAYIQVGESQVEITWQCEGFAEEAGTYTFTAVLPNGYALAEDAPALKLKVNMGVAEVLNHTCDHGTFSTVLTSDITGLTEGSYYLDDSVVCPSKVTISGTVSLCLCGRTLGSNGTFVISEGATLNLYDCNGDGKLIGGYSGSSEHGVRNLGTFNLYGGEVTTNSTSNLIYAVRSGETNASSNAVFNMSGGSVTREKCRYAKCVYIGKAPDGSTEPNFTLSGGTITGADDKGDAGAQCVLNDGIFSMTGGTITKGSASYGAGVENHGTFNMSNGVICGNVATTSNSNQGGGGVHNAEDGIFNLSGGTIGGEEEGAGNTTKGNGGGVYSEGTLKVTGGSIIGNYATSSGGGIYAKNNVESLFNATIHKNVGDFSGGGIYLDTSEDVTIENCTITFNKAVGDNGGGVLFETEGLSFTLKNCTMSENEGSNGGAVYSDGNLTVESCTISNNDALKNSVSTGGGGIYSYGLLLTIKDSTFTGNTALHTGGALFHRSNTAETIFTLEDTEITGNSAGVLGGGTYSWSRNISLGGKVEVYDNYVTPAEGERKPYNLFINDDRNITVNSENPLINEHPIGITLSDYISNNLAQVVANTQKIMTSGGETYKDNFASDDTRFILFTEDDSLKIGNLFVVCETSDCGSITVDNYRPANGTKVTVTVNPKIGYSVTNVIVKAGPRSREVTKVDDTTYTFKYDTIYGLKYTVSATYEPTGFKEITTHTQSNGKVTVSNMALPGKSVTVTPEPDEGYFVKSVQCTDEGGNVVPVTKDNNGVYTFTMPESAVTVSATFELIVPYNVWVGGERFTSAKTIINGTTGTATYVPGTGNNPGTLTLDGFSYSGSGYAYDDGCCAAIYFTDALNIVLQNANAITCTTEEEGVYAPGIYGSAALSISGNSGATLDVTASDDGIWITNSVTIDHANVNINGGAYGIDAVSVAITDSTVTASAIVSGDDCYGIDCSTLTITGSNVSATSGACGNSCETAGIRSDSASITNSIVTATGGTVSNVSSSSYGMAFDTAAMPIAISDTESTQSDLTISRSTVIAQGKDGGIFGSVTLASDHLVYAGNDENADPVSNPTTETYASKYVKITPVVYTVTVEDSQNGTVTVSKESAPAGTEITVTVSVTSPADYKIGSVTVTPGDENQPVTVSGIGSTYTFTMPNCNVTVSATFENVAKYNLWVGGVQVTELNKDDIYEAIKKADSTATVSGNASYNPETSTLTLNGFTYTGAGYQNAAIYVKDVNLKVELIGTNTISNNNERGYAIYVKLSGPSVNLDISGTDKADDKLVFAAKNGIYVESEMTINNATVSSTTSGSITSYQKTTISNSEVSIFGILDVAESGAITTITNSSVKTAGINAASLSIANSNITATGARIQDSSGFKHTGISAYGSLSITNSTVEACGNDVGIYIWGTDSSITVDSDLKVIAGSNNSDAAYVASPDDNTYATNRYVKIFPGYIITFVSNGGSAVAPIAVEKAKPEVTQLPRPNRANHTFGGWYTDENLTDTAVTPVTLTGDMTLYAKWTADTYNVAYEHMDGAVHGENYPTKHTYGTATPVPHPTMTGYTFAGWKVNNQEQVHLDLTLGAEEFTADITLSATWTANTYDAIFRANGGKWADNTATKTVSTVFGQSIIAPANPERAGYTFADWDYSVGTMNTEGKTFNAKWTPDVTVNAKTGLVYNGSAQELVTVSCPEDAAMYYALGENASVKPTDNAFKETPAKGTNAGEYYVWYYTSYDNTEKTDAACEKVTIDSAKLKNVSVAQKDPLTYNGTAQTPNVTTAATAVGDQTVTFIYSVSENDRFGSMPKFTDAGENYKVYYKASAENHDDATGFFIVTVDKADISPVISITGWTYGETANTPSVSGNPGGGEVTWSYKAKDAADSTYSANVPANAGAYTVKASVAETKNYNGKTVTADFTIAKATPTISWETKTFTYDGKSHGEATVTLVNGETYTGEITYTCGEVEGLPTNAGTYTVTASIAAHGNYNAATATANIQIQRKAVTPTVTLTPETFTYNNEAKEPAVLVKDGTTVLSAKEYSVAYASNVAVGAGNVCITDKTGGNYAVATANVKFLILPDTSALEGVTTENVTSANTAAIDAIQAAMANKDITGVSEEAKGAWDALAARCTDLEKAIADAAKRSEEITEDAAALPEDIKTSDLNKINEILNQYADIEDNLTAEQKAALADEIRELEKQKAAIEKTNADLKSVDDGTQDLVEDKPNLEYADKATIKALEDKIADIEKNNSYLSESDKQNLQTQKTTLATLKAEFVEADKVTEKVNALNTKAAPDDGNAVAAYEDAKKAYAELSDADKAKVDPAALDHLADMKAALTAYKIIKGDGTKHQLGSSQGLTIVSNGYYPHFRYVKVNGREISSSNYTSASGSTIVTLKPEYVNRLMTGKYTITIGFGDEDYIGEATANVQLYTDSGLPFTGDTIAMWIAMMAVSAGALIVVLVFAKKKFSNKK